MNSATVDRPCRFCSKQVVCRNPKVDYCEACYYAGNVQEEEHRALFDALNSADGVDLACIDHTGGGCFNMGIRLKDGRFVCATEDNDPGVPDAGKPWGLITLWPNHENWGEGEPLKAIEGSWSDDQIVGVIRDLIA